MPAVVVAAGATALGSVVGASIGGFFATAFGKALITGGIAFLGMSAIARPKSAGGFQAESQDRQVMVRSAIEPRRIVYGQIPVSGPLIFAHVSRESGVAQAQGHFVVPSTAPYTVAVNSATPYQSTVEVAVEDRVNSTEASTAWTPLTVTAGAPGATEYSVSAGTYTFNSSLAGFAVRIVYRYGTGEVTNSFLHLVIPVAGHEVQEIGTVYLGDDEIPSSDLDGSGNVVTGKYAHHVRIKKYLGTLTQTADADLVAESGGKWTASRRGLGVAYIYVRLRRNPDLFPNGLPNIRAMVKGAKVLDPRTGTTAWSNNWALIVNDYMRRADGLGCDADEIAAALVSAAANAADEDVAIDALATTQKRYTIDGTVNLAERPLDILRALVTAGAGTAVYSVSTWDVYAGVYHAPTFSLTVSDLRSAITGSADVERRDLFNGVRGTFVDEDRGYQPTSFPPVTNASYVAADNAEEIFKDIEQPYVTNAIRAQRIAKIFLERARQATQCAWPGKPKLFRRNTWETANVTVVQLGWNPKVMRVTGWKWQPGGAVDYLLREESASIYDWAYGEATVGDPAPNTTLPNTGVVGTPGAPVVTEALVEANDGRNVEVEVTLVSAASTHAYAERYQFEHKLVSAADWIVHSPVTVPTITLRGLEPGLYDWRAQAISSLGRRSLYAQTRQEIVGLSADPADVTGFFVTVHEGRARCHVDLPPDLDVRKGGRLWVRWTPLTVGATWNDGSLIKADGYPGDALVVEGPLYPGTYMAKWADSTGHLSVTEASFVVTEALLTGFVTLDTVTYHPDFSGTKSSVAAVDGALQLAGTTLWDAMVGNLDDQDRIDSLGGIQSSGSCTFTAKQDLGSVQTVRLFPHVKTLGFDTGDLWDSRTTLMDEWGLVDGSVIEDAEIQVQVRATQDDPNGAPVWGPWHNLEVADYTARGFEYRTLHTSANVTHNRKLIEFSVAAKQ